MHIKNWQYYFIIGIPVAIIITYFFCPLYPTTSTNNETIFLSMFGWKFNDGSVFAALLTSIITILVTHYSVNKNYKSIKLSALPDNSMNLLIDLEFKFYNYKTCNKDEFILLTEILKYWKSNQKAFKLLTPKFYSDFLRITHIFLKENTAQLEIREDELHNKTSEEKEETPINEDNNHKNTEETDETQLKENPSNENNKNENTKENDENTLDESEKITDYGDENSDYILRALIVQITNTAFENDEPCFEFINPKLVTDDNIQELGEDLKNYSKIKITTPTLKEYTESIAGNSTQKSTIIKFETFHNEIKKLLDTLKKEIEEYD